MGTVSTLIQEKGAEVVAVPAEESVLNLARLMAEKHIGAVLVREGETPVGIVSERDLTTRVLLPGLDPGATRAREIMTRDLVAVSPSATVQEAMAVMTHQRCRHLPVMEGSELVGLVSIGDCTRWVSRDQSVVIRHLRDYIADKYPR